MKPVRLSSFQMMNQIRRDWMLSVIVLVPILVGMVLRFLVPLAELLWPYYGLLDLFLLLLTPSMLCYAGAMIMLEEADEGMIAYLSVTPLRKRGYLLSRLGFAGAVSVPFSIFLALLFQLSNRSFFDLMLLALAAALQGVVIALLIVTLSSNKVEGLAIGKLSTLFNLGVVAPYFLKGRMQYLFAPMPAFWMGKAVETNQLTYLIFSFLMTCLWIGVLADKFKRRIEK